MRLVSDDYSEDDSPVPQTPESPWAKCSTVSETPKSFTLESMKPKTLSEASPHEPVSELPECN